MRHFFSNIFVCWISPFVMYCHCFLCPFLSSLPLVAVTQHIVFSSRPPTASFTFLCNGTVATVRMLWWLFLFFFYYWYVIWISIWLLFFVMLFFWFAVVYLIVRCLPSSIWSALSSALCHCGRFTSDGTQRQFIFISHYFVFFVLS